jgi:hypothetical protein
VLRLLKEKKPAIATPGLNKEINALIQKHLNSWKSN